MRKCWKHWRGDNREVINPDLEIPSDFNDRIKHSHGIREKSKWKCRTNISVFKMKKLEMEVKDYGSINNFTNF